MRILLVDDSTTMRKIQRRTLTQMGITEVTEAGNGVEALQELSVAGAAYDLVICDINMPELDGIATLRKIRQTPALTKLPVIMCTSVAEKDQVLKAIKAGANNYIVKPFRPDDLQQKIEATLQKSQA